MCCEALCSLDWVFCCISDNFMLHNLKSYSDKLDVKRINLTCDLVLLSSDLRVVRKDRPACMEKSCSHHTSDLFVAIMKKKKINIERHVWALFSHSPASLLAPLYLYGLKVRLQAGGVQTCSFTSAPQASAARGRRTRLVCSVPGCCCCSCCCCTTTAAAKNLFPKQALLIKPLYSTSYRSTV